MKKRLIAGSLALLVPALCSCQSQQSAEEKPAAVVSVAARPERDPKVVEEITSLVMEHDKALAEKNLDGVMATFTPGPETVFLGTSNAERFIGAENIRNAYIEIFKDYDPNTLITNCDWKTGQHLGNMAWMAATCQAKDSLNGKSREYGLNVTAATVKQDGKWRFAMLHMSNPTLPR